MIKLLSANISRLIKNKIFYIEMGVTAILSVFIVFCNYNSEIQATENRMYLDDVFFTMYLLLGFVLAAGISLIVGAEYSDGTIRNKIIVGYSRSQVYFSELIASIIPSCLVLAVHGIITYGLGYFLFGGFQTSAGQIAAAVSVVLLTALVFTALFAAIAMNCSNKAVTAVISLLLVLGLLYASTAFDSILSEPEMSYDGVTISADGTIKYGNMVHNPAYVSGFKRTVIQFIYDFLPSGQLLQMYKLDFTHCARLCMLSIILFILITAFGFMSFRKKSIK